ncbi:hypothetical protein H9Y04_15855 [Streptomyces sp. TRM66268-LWL]|uniref:Secreted protein n=2 Tax=Streptomyces polyasparticus TaxID=2767826 RepID=A0ABR7SHT2_9ACTN|nr:hypothetical protein [Streptomyces polyasparticus]
MGAIALGLIVVVLRRGSRTENADGLLIEQSARQQAHDDRVTYRYTDPFFDVAPPRRDHRRG